MKTTGGTRRHGFAGAIHARPKEGIRMKRRHFLAIVTLTFAAAGPVLAQNMQKDFVNQLHAQGFKNLSITHTWLGRTRITGSNGQYQRELVFNSRSGEILRDYWQATSGPKKDEVKDAVLLNAEPPVKDAAKDGGDTGYSGGDGGNGGGDGAGGDGAGGDGGSGDGGSGGDGHSGHSGG